MFGDLEINHQFYIRNTETIQTKNINHAKYK